MTTQEEKDKKIIQIRQMLKDNIPTRQIKKDVKCGDKLIKDVKDGKYPAPLPPKKKDKEGQKKGKRRATSNTQAISKREFAYITGKERNRPIKLNRFLFWVMAVNPHHYQDCKAVLKRVQKMSRPGFLKDAVQLVNYYLEVRDTASVMEQFNRNGDKKL